MLCHNIDVQTDKSSVPKHHLSQASSHDTVGFHNVWMDVYQVVACSPVQEERCGWQIQKWSSHKSG